jgi:tetratricopeptide (TPR) repeat protein
MKYSKKNNFDNRLKEENNKENNKIIKINKTLEEKLEELKIVDNIEDILNNKNKEIPKTAYINNDKGVEAYRKGDFNAAINFYKEALKEAPHFKLAMYNLANAYFGNNDIQKAINLYEKVILLDPKDEFSYYNLANCYLKISEYKKALVYYKKAIEISPGDYATHYNLGKAFENMKKYDDAINSYKKAIELKKDYYNAHYNLAELYRFKGLNRKAIKHFDLYLKYNLNADDSEEVKKIIVDLMSKI